MKNLEFRFSNHFARQQILKCTFKRYTKFRGPPSRFEKFGGKKILGPLISPPILDIGCQIFFNRQKVRVSISQLNFVDLSLTGDPRKPIKFFNFLDGGRL